MEGPVRALPGRAECCWTAVAPATSYPRLQGTLTADVAVVGGGIVGMTAALHLARWGCSVAGDVWLQVIRQDSGRFSAKITTQDRLIYDLLVRTLGPDAAELYADVIRNAAEFIEACIRELGIACDFDRCSAMVWFEP